MGFLSFGKKDNKMPNMADSLDIPPPPPMDNFKSMPEMPPMGMPPMGAAPALSDSGMQRQSMRLPKEQPIQGFDIPPISQSDMAIPKMQDNSFFAKKESPMQMPEVPQFESAFEEQEPPKRNSRTQKVAVPQSIQSGKPIFIEVTEYRQIVKNVSDIKETLKSADEEINSLMADLAAEDKAFESISKILSDVEERLSGLEDNVFKQV